MKTNKYVKILLIIVLIVSLGYGAARLYYRVTDGFTIGNITSDFKHDPRWDTRPLASDEKELVGSILDQKFTYLGKGCQSYVFQSADNKYVVKFFKYQRFRPQEWLEFFSFIPAVEEYRLGKIEKKTRKREGLFESWKICFDELQPETGLIFVHLNKTNDLNKVVTFSDKMGIEHQIDLDQMEFLIQRKVKPYCKTITELMEQNKVDEAKLLLTRTLALILSENARGLADNDHALMQNSGVSNGRPMHVDVGQFVHNEEISDPIVYKQELFNKTFRFREWLHKKHPVLEQFLENELRLIIGSDFDSYVPIFIPHDEK